MRGVIQRVSQAEVRVEGRVVGKIGRGILLLLGISRHDDLDDGRYILKKTLELRIFPDDKRKMNRSLTDIEGELLVVSQFTLHGDCRKGRRPSYSDAMELDRAKELYGRFLELADASPVPVSAGEFQAMMDVVLVNDGPVTLLLDSDKTF